MTNLKIELCEEELEIKLSKEELEILYKEVKNSGIFPEKLVERLGKVVSENMVENLEESKKRLELESEFKSNEFLKNIYHTIKEFDIFDEYDTITFMEDIKDETIKIFNNEHEWFESYIGRYVSETYKSDLRYLVKEKINEEDKGKTILHKFLELQLKEEPNLYLVDGKIVVCYF